MNIFKQVIKVLLTIFISCSGNSFAQTAVGIGTVAPDNKAILHVNATTKGVLIPRLAISQQATLAALLNNTHKGLLITDSAVGTTLYWDGTSFKNFDPLVHTATSPLSVTSTNAIALNAGTAAGDLLTWDGNNWVNLQPAIQHFNITVDNRQPLLVLNYCIALQGIFPSRNSSPFLAEIGLFSFSFAPKGWAQCNGQLLPINQNQALFALVGTYYGGNGVNNFALPNLRGKVPLHTNNSTYTQGQTSGTESNNIVK